MYSTLKNKLSVVWQIFQLIGLVILGIIHALFVLITDYRTIISIIKESFDTSHNHKVKKCNWFSNLTTGGGRNGQKNNQKN